MLCVCSWGTQLRVLLKRAMLAQLRNPTDTTSRLFLSTWVGVLAGAAPDRLTATVSRSSSPSQARHTPDTSLLHKTRFPCPSDTLLCAIGAGLVFFNLTDGAESVEKRLALLFFLLLLFELLPFCYMSFYVADRRFFAADVANDLYHPSAYYVSAVIAGMSWSLLRCQEEQSPGWAHGLVRPIIETESFT